MANEKTIIIDFGVPESVYHALETLADAMGTTVSMLCSSCIRVGLPIVTKKLKKGSC